MAVLSIDNEVIYNFLIVVVRGAVNSCRDSWTILQVALFPVMFNLFFLQQILFLEKYKIS
jgi:hypothetical protein